MNEEGFVFLLAGAVVYIPIPLLPLLFACIWFEGGIEGSG